MVELYFMNSWDAEAWLRRVQPKWSFMISCLDMPYIVIHGLVLVLVEF